MLTSDPKEQFSELKTQLLQQIASTFPVKDRFGKLEVRVSDLSVDDKLGTDDIKDQFKTKMEGRTWAAPVTGTLQIVDTSTGKVMVTRKNALIAKLPKMTRQYSYIVGGTEKFITNQWRLRPGIYVKATQKPGEYEAQFQLAKGKHFNVQIGDSGELFMGMGGRKIPLLPVLHALGVSDEKIQKTWGKDTYEASAKKAKGAKDLASLNKAWRGADLRSGEDAALAARALFENTLIDPAVAHANLGIRTDRVDGNVLFEASKKLLDVAAARKPADPIDSLRYKELWTTKDQLIDRLAKATPEIERRMQSALSKPKIRQRIADGDGSVLRDVFMPDLIQRPIYHVFTTSLAASGKQTNPLSMLADHSTVTITGPGGIENMHAISKSNTSLDPSHLALLDPVFTPESNAGVNTHMAFGVSIKNRKPYAKLFNLRTGKLEDVDAADMAVSNVVLPDQVRWANGRPTPIKDSVRLSDRQGHIRDDIPFSKADYVIPSAAQVFGVETNLVPFMQNDSAGRTSMSARHMSQAISVVGREAPVVQVEAGGGKTFEALVGSSFLSHKSPVDGVVKAVHPDEIIVEAGGHIHSVHLYDHYPTNHTKGELHSTPLVKPGDHVKAGQILADNNFSKNGVLALGANLRTAYLANGSNHEDGIVISRSAAHKLASEHLYKPSLLVSDTHKLGKKAFLTHKLGVYDKARLDKIDDDGMVKPGTIVHHGDPLVLALGEAHLPGAADMSAKAKIGARLRNKYQNSSLVWDGDYPAEVVRVARAGKNLVVHLKTAEPAQVGSKISTRHSAKGIVAAVMDDKDMPHDADGKHVEMLINPLGVPGRMNAGQILETAAGKIAEKTGKPYLIKNFQGGVDYLKKVKSELKQHGLSELETLYDPHTGRRLGDITVGPHYAFQLEHQIDKKTHVRSGGPDLTMFDAPKLHYDNSTKVPRGGGHAGAQSLGSLGIYSALASGLHNNLREMATLKTDQAQARELWGALSNGDRVPAPRIPFVMRKFEALLTGLGVNVEKTGSSIRLMPRSDEEVKKLSRGEIKRPTRLIRGKDDKPEPGGLFDPHITGGPAGQHWGHIELVEPMPNPVYERAIAHTLGIKQSDIHQIIEGKAKLPDGSYGGKAIREALSAINIDKALAETSAQLKDPKLKGSDLNKAHFRYHALKTVKESGKNLAEAWTLKNVPVLPPVFRPLSTLPDGTIKNDPLNGLYKRLGMVNDSLKAGESKVPYNSTLDARAGLYAELGNLFGTVPKGKKALDLDVRGTKEDPNKKLPGIIHMLSGEQPKDGFFQDKMIEKKQDYTARATIVADPSLSVEEIGLPKKIGLELLRPMVAKRLTDARISPEEAHRMISHQHPTAVKALEKELEHRPLLMKRDPVLHQYGLVAQRAKVTDSPAIKLSPLILPPLGADVDGDSCWGNLHIRVNAVPEWLQKATGDNIISSLEERCIAPAKELAMPFLRSARVPTSDGAGAWVSIDLKDFPRVGEPRTNSRGVIEYDVPDFIEVFALDNTPGSAVRPYKVSAFSIHPNLDMVRVMTRSGRCAEVSTDHSLFCVDPRTFQLAKSTPGESLGRLTPRPRRIAVEEVDSVGVVSTRRGVSKVELTPDLGYTIGVLIGDGWADSGGCVCLGKAHHKDLLDRVTRGLRQIVPDLSDPGTLQTGYGVDRGSNNKKGVFSSVDLTKIIAGWIGRGAENKMIPDFALDGPEEFRWALLSGLLDTDGGFSRDKNDRFSVNYSTASWQLSEAIQLLCATLGLRTSSNSYTRSGKQTAYYITFWTQDLSANAKRLKLCVPRKAGLLHELGEKVFVENPTLARQDVVPVSSSLADYLSKKINALGTTLYTAMRKLVNGDQYTTRYTARKVVQALGEAYVLEHPHGPAFLTWLNEENVVWDVVDAVDPIPGTHEAYDLTIPGPYTFMLTSQLIVWDTIVLAVPITQGSVEEAKRILPSARTISDASGDVLYAPANESALSLYRMSIPRGQHTTPFKSKAEAETAFAANRLMLNQKIYVDGVGHTTLGRLRIADILPEKYRKDVLTNLDKPFDRKQQTSILKEVAKTMPKHFVETVDGMSRLGFKMAYESGHTIGLNDLEPLREQRDKIIADTKRDVSLLKNDKEKAVEKWLEATRKIHDVYNNTLKGRPTNVSDMAPAPLGSGIKAKKEQFQGLIMAPMLVEDHLGRPSHVPITKSFAEGIDVGGYFLQASGARRGVIQKTDSVREPGYMSKLLIQANIDQPITSHDCGTDQGVAMSIGNKDVVDRFLVRPVALGGHTYPAGAPVTPEFLAHAKEHKIDQLMVRSPLKCRMPQGVCAKCMGLHPTGATHQLGEAVGVVAAQTLGERAAQLMLKQTHGGGIVSVSGSPVDEFSVVQRLFDASEKSREEAAVAPISGKVTSIQKSRGGDWLINIGKSVARSRQKPLAHVAVGAEVKKGDVLTHGDPNIHDLLKTKGLEAVQSHMVNRIGDIYGKEGILRRHVELAVRNATGVVRVTDPGDHTGYIRGDYLQKPVVDELNRTVLDGKKPIEYTTMLTPIKSNPLYRVTDWIGRLQGERIGQSILTGIQHGHTSDVAGLHPISSLAVGVTHGIPGAKPFGGNNG